MKTVQLLISLAALGSLTSCFNKGPKGSATDMYTDTLTYQYQNIKSRADDCGSKPDSGCTVVSFKYPKFDNQPLLNDSIVTNVATLLDRNQGLAGLQRLTWNFLTSYKEFKKKNPSSGAFFTLDTKANVIRQDSSLVGIELTGYQFAGGAHGNTVTKYFNWNTQSRKKIELSDLLKAGSEQQLNAIAEKIFRKQEKLAPSAPLSKDYFFKDGKFSLNKNFLITPIGLKFLFNQYEIKPYAAGQTTVDIPYDQINPLIQPNTVLARYTTQK